MLQKIDQVLSLGNFPAFFFFFLIKQKCIYFPCVEDLPSTCETYNTSFLFGEGPQFPSMLNYPHVAHTLRNWKESHPSPAPTVFTGHPADPLPLSRLLCPSCGSFVLSSLCCYHCSFPALFYWRKSAFSSWPKICITKECLSLADFALSWGQHKRVIAGEMVVKTGSIWAVPCAGAPQGLAPLAPSLPIRLLRTTALDIGIPADFFL